MVLALLAGQLAIKLSQTQSNSNSQTLKSQTKKRYLNGQDAEAHLFCEWDKVLALLPIVRLPLQAKFFGPHSVGIGRKYVTESFNIHV